MQIHNILTSLQANMSQPGTYLHWSIFTVAVANLIIIAIMLVLFGLALLLPFPKEPYLKEAAVEIEYIYEKYFSL